MPDRRSTLDEKLRLALESLTTKPSPIEWCGCSRLFQPPNYLDYLFASSWGKTLTVTFDRLHSEDKRKLTDLAKKSPNFRRHFCEVMSRNFLNLSDDTKETLLDFAKIDKNGISIWFMINIATLFAKLDDKMKDELIELAQTNQLYARGLACAVGKILYQLDGHYRNRLIQLAEDNEKFLEELWRQNGSFFDLLGHADKERILTATMRYIDAYKLADDFAVTVEYVNAHQVGSEFGCAFRYLTAESKKRILELIEANHNYAKAFGEVALSYHELDDSWKDTLLELARSNDVFAAAFARKMYSCVFEKLTRDYQEKLLELARVSESFRQEFYIEKNAMLPLPEHYRIEITQK